MDDFFVPPGSRLTRTQIFSGIRFVPDVPGRYAIDARVWSKVHGTLLRASFEVEVPDVPVLAPVASGPFSCTRIEFWGERVVCLTPCAPDCGQRESDILVLARDGSSLRAEALIAGPHYGGGIAAAGEHLFAVVERGREIRGYRSDDLATPAATLALMSPVVDVGAGSAGLVYVTDIVGRLYVVEFTGSAFAERHTADRMPRGSWTPRLFGDGVMVFSAASWIWFAGARSPRAAVASLGECHACVPMDYPWIAGVASGLPFVEDAFGGLRDGIYEFADFDRMAADGPLVAAAGPLGTLVLRRGGDGFRPVAAIRGAHWHSITLSGNRLAASRALVDFPFAHETAVYEIP